MKKLIAPVLFLSVSAVLFAPAAARAATSCTYGASGHIVKVTMTAYSDSATIARNGTAIAIDGTNCGAATVLNTDTIAVTGADGYQSLTISRAGGPFAPGFTAEPSGASEIEFSVALGRGSDVLRVEGSSANDNVRIGTLGINLNGDPDADVKLLSVDYLSVSGGAGRDSVSAAASPATGSTYPTSLSLDGGEGDDVLTGGDGNDGLWGDAGADTLNGGNGPDRLSGLDGPDRLYGGADADSLDGHAGNDVLEGGPGTDVLEDSGDSDGDDVFGGGAGTDLLSYYFRTVHLAVSIDGVANDGRPSYEHDNVKTDVENLEGGSASDTLTGSEAANVIDARGGNNVVNGLGGDDSLTGEGGADTYRGGDGDDLLTGDYGGNDRLYGEADSDTLRPGHGADFVDGGTGADTLFSESFVNDGNDDFRGGAGVDTIDYSARSSGIGVSLNGAADDGTYPEGDNVRPDVENVNAGAGNDQIIGSAAANTIDGGAGNDDLNGGDGNDELYGWIGDDGLNGGDGFDTLDGWYGSDFFRTFDGDFDSGDGGPDIDQIYEADPFDSFTNVP